MFCKIRHLGSRPLGSSAPRQARDLSNRRLGESIVSLSSFPRRDWPCDISVPNLSTIFSPLTLQQFPRRDWPYNNAAEARRMKIAAATPVSERGTGRANPVLSALWSRLPRLAPVSRALPASSMLRPSTGSGLQQPQVRGKHRVTLVFPPQGLAGLCLHLGLTARFSFQDPPDNPPAGTGRTIMPQKPVE